MKGIEAHIKPPSSRMRAGARCESIRWIGGDVESAVSEKSRVGREEQIGDNAEPLLFSVLLRSPYRVFVVRALRDPRSIPKQRDD